MIPHAHIGTYTGRQLRDTFKDEAIAMVRLQTTDADINPGYLLATRYHEGAPGKPGYTVYRVAYCVDGTKHIWKVVEIDGRKIVQIDGLVNVTKERHTPTPVAYRRSQVVYA